MSLKKILSNRFKGSLSEGYAFRGLHSMLLKAKSEAQLHWFLGGPLCRLVSLENNHVCDDIKILHNQNSPSCLGT